MLLNYLFDWHVRKNGIKNKTGLLHLNLKLKLYCITMYIIKGIFEKNFYLLKLTQDMYTRQWTKSIHYLIQKEFQKKIKFVFSYNYAGLPQFQSSRGYFSYKIQWIKNAYKMQFGSVGVGVVLKIVWTDYRWTGQKQ